MMRRLMRLTFRWTCRYVLTLVGFATVVNKLGEWDERRRDEWAQDRIAGFRYLAECLEAERRREEEREGVAA